MTSSGSSQRRLSLGLNEIPQIRGHRRGLQPAEPAEDTSAENIETRIEHLTKALASVLLPMINSLASLGLEGALAMSASGEDT